MIPIDEILARALLLEETWAPQDIVPWEEREEMDVPPALDTGSTLSQKPDHAGGDHASARAGRDLLALCEVLVANTPASALRGFVTEQLPGPHRCPDSGLRSPAHRRR